MQRDLVLLEEMIEAAEQICALCRGVSGPELDADRLRGDAVLWNFTVLGEAAGQLSEELRSSYSQVEWRRPIELRHRIVHGVLVDRYRDPRGNCGERPAALPRRPSSGPRSGRRITVTNR